MADGFLEKGLFDFALETPLVAFVPMGENRIRERGYNQAQRLAESFCDRLKAKGVETELCENMLYKRVETLSQKDVDKNTRRKNAQDAYRVQEKKLCKDRTVLLIDDIMTTGATGSACAEKLLKAGAKRVLFITACSLSEKVRENTWIDNFLLK
jgi:predicted amidophosphoribosyltransferase